jgi:hypothetical protein
MKEMPPHKVPKIKLSGPGLQRTREAPETEIPGAARTALSARFRVAFVHPSGATRTGDAVREFLATPVGWLEVSPGILMNVGLADGEPLHEALRLAAEALDHRRTAAIGLLGGPYRQVEIMPTRVPVKVRVRGLGQHFTRWLTQRWYRWAVSPFEPHQVRLVSRGGKPVDLEDVPAQWRPRVENLTAKDVGISWATATAYGSHTGLPLWWVEATVANEAGGRLETCLAGHRFVWIGRTSRKWCPDHQVQVDALLARHRRLAQRIPHAAPAGREVLQGHLAECGAALARLGYQWESGKAVGRRAAPSVKAPDPAPSLDGLSAPKDLQPLAQTFGLRPRAPIPAARQDLGGFHW